MSGNLIKRSRRLLTEDEERTLVARMLAGDRGARDSLVEAHIPLAAAVSNRYRKLGNRDDLMQEALLAIVSATNHYDPGRGMRFSSYAFWWIRAALYRFVVRNVSVVSHPTTARARREFSQKLRTASLNFDKSLDMTTPAGTPLVLLLRDRSATTEDDLVEAIDQPRRVSDVRGALRVLSDRERHVIERRYFCDNDQPTYLEVASDFGVTRQRIEQIERRAIKKIAAVMTAKHSQRRAA